MDWLELIKPYTQTISINHSNKNIILVHPHFKTGTLGYRQLLKSIKYNKYKDYTVTCIGLTSVYGSIILSSLKRYLDKQDNVEYVKLVCNLDSATYNMSVKFF